MTDSVPLKTFARKIAKYRPELNYRKALRLAHSEALPVWPRIGQENFCVKVSALRPFCQQIGLGEEELSAFMRELLE